ncbi:uncharacterized protein LOC141850731 isoform X2 [Brevipalpus obovatus]
MNMGSINDEKDPLSPYVYYWYLQRTPISDILPKFKVDGTIQGFLTSDARCVPRFSFLQYNQHLNEEFMKNIAFSYPAVLVTLRPKNINDDSVVSEIDNKTQPLEIATKKKFPKLSFTPDIFSFFSYFEGFHINRYSYNAKIIITDWSDPLSARPDMNDSSFPVKSVLCLATSVTEYCARIGKIEKLLKKSKVNKPILTGGVLRLLYEWSGDDDRFVEMDITSTISYFDPQRGELGESFVITIAFAGEKVKSAAHDVFFSPSFEEKLEEFKCGLDFSTDDDRVLGFIIERWYCDLLDSSYPSRATSKIKSLFPSIRTSTIAIEFRSHLPEDSTPGITLLLIRI